MSTKDEPVLFGRLLIGEFIPIGMGGMFFMTLVMNAIVGSGWGLVIYSSMWWGLVINSASFLLGAAAARAICWWGRVQVESRIATGAKQKLAKAGLYLLLNAFGAALYLAILAMNQGQHDVTTSEQDNRQTAASVETDLLNAANEVTRSAPKMLDTFTRLDGAVSGPGLLFSYLYTLTNIESSKKADPKVFSLLFGPSFRKAVCVDDNFRPMFDQQVSIRFVYRATDGGSLGETIVRPSDCAAMRVEAK